MEGREPRTLSIQTFSSKIAFVFRSQLGNIGLSKWPGEGLCGSLFRNGNHESRNLFLLPLHTHISSFPKAALDVAFYFLFCLYSLTFPVRLAFPFTFSICLDLFPYIFFLLYISFPDGYVVGSSSPIIIFSCLPNRDFKITQNPFSETPALRNHMIHPPTHLSTVRRPGRSRKSACPASD